MLYGVRKIKKYSYSYSYSPRKKPLELNMNESLPVSSARVSERALQGGVHFGHQALEQRILHAHRVFRCTLD
jgi:hypothetical protein